jgi:hypothetical protein
MAGSAGFHKLPGGPSGPLGISGVPSARPARMVRAYEQPKPEPMATVSELDRDPASEAVVDPTPPSVRRALDVVARHGELTRNKILALDDEERKAIWTCIREYKTALALSIARASDAGDEEAYWSLVDRLCGWLNFCFDLECSWKLQALPEEEAEKFRSKPVNPTTWKQLRTRSRWYTAYPHRHATRAPSCRPRGALRRGPRRRSVRTGPRRARAPGSQGGDPEPPLARTAAASARLVAHIARRQRRRFRYRPGEAVA